MLGHDCNKNWFSGINYKRQTLYAHQIDSNLNALLSHE